MSRSVSILLTEQPTIEEVESLIAEMFEVKSWFPRSQHWTVEHDTTQVFLDYDTNYRNYYDQCECEARKARIEEQLGQKPTFALHVQISHYSGSTELAYRVAYMVMEKWKGLLDEE
jgi:hypothetical protein